MVNTNIIRALLLEVTRKATNKRIDKLALEVLGLCDSYDEITSMERIIEAGEKSLDHSFEMIEKLRKSL